MFYTYILRCKDNSLYTGIAADYAKRFKQHTKKASQAAKYTKTHPPVSLEAVWKSADKSLAAKLEYRIKRLKKAQKEELIKTDNFDVFLNKIEASDYERVII